MTFVHVVVLEADLGQLYRARLLVSRPPVLNQSPAYRHVPCYLLDLGPSLYDLLCQLLLLPYAGHAFAGAFSLQDPA